MVIGTKPRRGRASARPSLDEDWQVPDWLSEDAYPSDPLSDAPESPRRMAAALGAAYAAELSESYWRWEFLRRHPEYRHDWLKYRRRKLKGSEKFDIAGPWPDPREARPWPLMFMRSFQIFSDRDFVVRWGFDLKRPIEPQIKEARKGLRAFQKHHVHSGFLKGAEAQIKSRKQPPWQFVRYLRALDAREGAGATFEEIGRVILGHKDPSDAASLGQRLYRSATKARETISGIRYGVDPTEFTIKLRR